MWRVWQERNRNELHTVKLKPSCGFYCQWTFFFLELVFTRCVCVSELGNCPDTQICVTRILILMAKFRPHDVPDDIRFDRFVIFWTYIHNYLVSLLLIKLEYYRHDHWPEFLEDTAKWCRYQNCNSRARSRCNKCMVSLCVIKDKDCFQKYHTKLRCVL